MLPHLVSISSFQSATCLRVFLLVTSKTTIQAWRRTVRRPQTSYDHFKIILMLMLLVMSAHTQRPLPDNPSSKPGTDSGISPGLKEENLQF